MVGLVLMESLIHILLVVIVVVAVLVVVAETMMLLHLVLQLYDHFEYVLA